MYRIGAGGIKSSGRAILMFSGFHPRVKPAGPAPRIAVDRSAGAARDRTDLNAIVIDVPAFVAFGRFAAGEGGHGLKIAVPVAGVKRTRRGRGRSD